MLLVSVVLTALGLACCVDLDALAESHRTFTGNSDAHEADDHRPHERVCVDAGILAPSVVACGSLSAVTDLAVDLMLAMRPAATVAPDQMLAHPRAGPLFLLHQSFLI